MKKVTMRDIGRAAGVSAVTVSKALAGKPGMSEDVRRKILQITQDMGYQYPNAEKTEEKTGLDIGILVPEHYFESVSFYSSLYKKLVYRLGQEGHFGLLEIVNAQAEDALALPQIMRTRHVDGIILLGQPAKPYYRMIAASGLPTVFLDFYDEQGAADSVVGDNTYGCYRLTSHLIKNGHTKIGFVGNVRATSSILDRYLGYYRAMMIHGLPIRENWILRDRDDHGNLTPLTLPRNLPTAFVCNCDVVAGRLITALRGRGLRVPEDISVTGFDDFVIDASPDISLSTFRVDTDSMIELAVKTITERCAGSGKPFGRVVVGGQPIYRGSEGAFAHQEG